MFMSNVSDCQTFPKEPPLALFIKIDCGADIRRFKGCSENSKKTAS